MSRNRLSTLFLMCAFPIHLWSLVVTFSNLETVIYRSTNVFDGIGYTAYSLLLALLESALLCLLLWLLGYLLPHRWDEDKRLAALVLVGWVMLAWAAIGQFYQFWLSARLQDSIDYVFLWLSYRRAFNPVALVLIFAVLASSVVLPIWLASRNKRFTTFMLRLFERISLLSWIYLALDALALIIVVFRNLWVLL